MPDPAFDIYRTRAGYLAVPDAPERAILAALEDGAADEPALRAALPAAVAADLPPRLAALVARELVGSDGSGRFRPVAQLLGTSYVSVPELRGAVCDYVALSPLSPCVSLRATWQAIAAADPSDDLLANQLQTLGRLTGRHWPVSDPRTRWRLLVAVLIEEHIAASTELHEAAGEVEIHPHHSIGIPHARLHLMIVAFMAGLAEAATPPTPSAPHGAGTPLVFTIQPTPGTRARKEK